MSTETLVEKGIKAAKEFMIRRGYEILDDHCDYHDIIALGEDDDIRFIRVSVRKDRRFEEDVMRKTPQRREVREIAAATWLARNEDFVPSDIEICFDNLDVLVLSDSRAFIRYHSNCLMNSGDDDLC